MAVVVINNRYGYINKKGDLVIPFNYDKAKPFENGFAYVEKNGKSGYIDKNGKIVVPLEYDIDEYFFW